MNNASPSPPSILAIDVGAGTQDVLLFDPDREPENCLKLVLPSQTIVHPGHGPSTRIGVEDPLYRQFAGLVPGSA